MTTVLEREHEVTQIERRSATRKVTWSREFNLLLACCAAFTDEDRINTPQEILTEPLDWRCFLALVEHHRVTPQVYRCLAQYSELIPERALAKLESACRENTQKSLWFTAELSRILSHLTTHGIHAIPYKGPVLAQMLYGDVTARQFSDLDVLVDAKDVIRAKSALAELGYESSVKLTPRQELAYISSGYEYSLDGPASKNLLELQWRILPGFYSIDLEFADLLDRAVDVRLAGECTPTLGTEDLFVVLCIHAAKHVWTQLSWLCDIAQLLSVSSIEWNSTLPRLRQLGIGRIVAVNLILAKSLFGLPLPCFIQEWLHNDPAASALADEVIPIIVRSEPYDTESVSYFRLMLRLRERWADRSRFLWRLVMTPSFGEWSVTRLPESLFPLYQAVRLGRLARRFARHGAKS